MTNDETRPVRPLLTRYEVEIPDDECDSGISYDEARMILVKNGLPLARSGHSFNAGSTKITFIGHETRDDN